MSDIAFITLPRIRPKLQASVHCFEQQNSSKEGNMYVEKVSPGSPAAL